MVCPECDAPIEDGWACSLCGYTPAHWNGLCPLCEEPGEQNQGGLCDACWEDVQTLEMSGDHDPQD